MVPRYTESRYTECNGLTLMSIYNSLLEWGCVSTLNKANSLIKNGYLPQIKGQGNCSLIDKYECGSESEN